MMYRPSNTVTERLKALFKKRIADGEIAYLGDSVLPGARVDVPGRPGYVYVRFPYGRDANGFTLFTPPTMARSSGAAYTNYPGTAVYVAVKYNNELEIVSAHYPSMDRAGINTSVLNPLNQQSKFVYTWQLTYGLANAVATAATSSALVTVKSFRHFVGNLFQTFDTPLEADKIDLSAYIPGTDEHCLAAIWVDTYTNTAEVTTSVVQDLDEPFDNTDIQELVADRPPDAMPLKAFILANGQVKVSQNPANETDLRQHMATPHIWGFPNILNTRERVRPNRTLVVGPYTTSGAGDLDLESGAQVIIVHKSNITNTAPTINDDSGDGYSIGSLWFDTSTGLLYVASDVTVGAAVWEGVAGSGASSPPFADTTAIVKGSADATKLLRFEVDGFTTGTTRVMTPPNYDGTIATLAGTETLSNKTLTQLYLLIGGFFGIFTHSNSADRLYSLPDYDGVLTTQDGAESLSNKIINNSSIGATTQGLGYFNALRLIIGGFAAIFTHANSANRTYTLPNFNGTLSTLAGTETLTNKTLTTPAIGNFTNAVHGHTNDAGGGQLSLAALAQSGAVNGDTIIYNAGSGVWLPGASGNLIAILRDEKTSGTNGGTSVTTTWNARDLNTELYDPGGIVSISSNQFTPIAGDYEILVFAPFFGGAAAQSGGRCRLYNVTGAAAVEEGISTFAATNANAIAILDCKFTANGTSAYRIDTYTSVGRATTGLGGAVADGSAEVYTCVLLRKVG